MECKTCGRKSPNEDANYCFYCGESFREAAYIKIDPVLQQQKQQSLEQAAKVKDKPITFINWLGSYGLLLIPYIGFFAFVGFLIYWSINKDIPETKRNWARATLVMVGINIVILYIILTSIIPIIMDTGILEGGLTQLQGNFKI